jgi:hypothetical protein
MPITFVPAKMPKTSKYRRPNSSAIAPVEKRKFSNKKGKSTALHDSLDSALQSTLHAILVQPRELREEQQKIRQQIRLARVEQQEERRRRCEVVQRNMDDALDLIDLMSLKTKK